MGGKIEVKSQYHFGTKFSFQILIFSQLKDDIFLTNEQKEIPKELEINSKEYLYSSTLPLTNDLGNILIVDDNPFNLFTLEGIINQTGMKAHKSLNGKEAIEKVIKADRQNEPFSLRFLDIIMPELSGKKVILFHKYLVCKGYKKNASQ